MERNRRKRIFVWALILAMLLQNIVYAGEWKQENSDWYYEQEGVRQVGWIHDGSGWYYMDQDGKLRSGWFQEGETWYFLNTVHDGFYGRALTDQWAWVDGYCYLFDSDGKMYANCTTPDGYEVNADGRWTVDGVVQFIDGKGIITKETASTNTFSGGSGGGSSSSGGSGGSSGGGGSSSGGSGGSSSGNSGSNQGGGSTNDDSDTDDGGFVSEEFPGVVFTEAVEIENVDFTVEQDSNTVVVSDLEAAQNWEVGEVYILHDEENSWNDIAVKVTGIEKSENGVVVHYEQPLLEELVDTLDISEAAESGGYFIPAEGVTAETANTSRMMKAVRMAPVTAARATEEKTFNAFEAINISFPMGDGTVSGEIKLDRVTCKYRTEKVDGKKQIVESELKADINANLSMQISAEGGSDDKHVIGTYIVPLNAALWVNINLYWEMALEGELKVGTDIKMETGFQYTQTDGVKPVFEIHPTLTQASLSGSAEFITGIETPITLFKIPLLTMGVESAVGIKGEADTVSADPFLFCMDSKFYTTAKISANIGKSDDKEEDDDKFEIGIEPPEGIEFEDWGITLTIPEKVWRDMHIEETGIVEKCTREDCSYKGIVTDAITGNPVNQAKVELFRYGSSAETVMTDQNGRFEGYILISTEHDLKVTADGYQPYETTVIPQMGKPPELAISLIPQDAKTGKLSATILNQNNDEPVANAKVEIIQKDNTVSVVYTDDNCICQADLIAGTYALRISADGFKECETSFEITEDGTTSLEIEMSPDQLSEEGVGGWEAYVTDSETGKPVSGATITILKDNVMDEVSTDSNGYAAASEVLEAGDYRVWVELPSGTPTMGKYELLLEEISITDGETATYEWELTPNRDPNIDNGLYGYVICDESRFYYVPNAHIEIYQGGKYIKDTYADESGYFECELEAGVDVEPYTLKISATGYEPFSRELWAYSNIQSSYTDDNDPIISLNSPGLKEVPVTFNISLSNGMPVNLSHCYFETLDGWNWLDRYYFGGLERKDGNTFTAELEYGTHVLHIVNAVDANTLTHCKPADVEFTIDENNEDNVVVNIKLELEEERSNKLLLDMESVEEIEMSEQLLVEEGVVDSEMAEGLENEEMQQDKESFQNENNEDEAELEQEPDQDKENEGEAELEEEPDQDKENESEAELVEEPVQDEENEGEAEPEKDPVQDEENESEAELEKDPVQDEENESEAELEKDPVQDEENEGEVELEKDPVQDEENESEAAELEEEFTQGEENESEGKEEQNNAEKESDLEIEALANVNDPQATDKNSKTDEDPSSDENSEHKETSQR